MEGYNNEGDLVLNYFNVFNYEVRQFMDPLSMDHYDLRSSYVHSDSRVKRLEDHNGTENQESESAYESDEEAETGESINGFGGSDEECLGSYWTSTEKSIFFHYLGRYSIHRLDEWKQQLPSKSKFEILNYYEVLKENLLLLKRSNMRTFGGILSRKELPIAYEVDEFFVSFEEEMGQMIRNEFEPLPRDDIPSSEYQDLISLENWNKRWKRVYSHNNIAEIQPTNKKPLLFSEKAIGFLINSCKEYAKKLIWSTVLIDFEQRSLSKDTLFNHDSETVPHNDDLVIQGSHKNQSLPHIISEQHVFKAIGYSKFAGNSTPTLAETVLQTTKKFKLEYDQEGKLFKNSKVTTALLPSLLQNSSMSVVFFEDPKHSNIIHNDTDLLIAKKLYTLNGGRSPKRRKLSGNKESFITDDDFDRINNPLELELCDWETEETESHDLQKSKNYQHIILEYFGNALRARISNYETSDGNQIQQLYQSSNSQSDSTSAHVIVDRLPKSILKRFEYTNT